MCRRAFLAIVVSAAAGGVSFGQEFPQPGPEHERLKELVGEWDAVMEMGGQKSKATAVYRPICGGMWIESDFEGNLGGMKFQGRGLSGYDLRKKRYVGVWVQSVESAPMVFEGDYDAEKKLMVMTGTSFSPEGEPQKFKTTTHTKDKDHFTFKMFMVQPDGGEELAFTIEYTRRK